MERSGLRRALGDFVAQALAEFANRLGGGVLEVRDVVLVRVSHAVVAASSLRRLLLDGRLELVLELGERRVSELRLPLGVEVARARLLEREFLPLHREEFALDHLRGVIRLGGVPQRRHRGVPRRHLRLDVRVRLGSRDDLRVQSRPEVRERRVHLAPNRLDANLVALGELANLLPKLPLDHVRRARNLRARDVDLHLQRLRLRHLRARVVVHLLLQLLHELQGFALILRRHLAHAVQLQRVLRQLVERDDQIPVRLVHAVAQAGFARGRRSEHRRLQRLRGVAVAPVLGLDARLELLDGVRDVLRLDVIRLGVERLRDGGDGEVLLDDVERVHDVALEHVEVELELGLPGVQLPERRHLHLHALFDGADAPRELHLRRAHRLRRLDPPRGEDALRLGVRLLHRRVHRVQGPHPGLDLRLDDRVQRVALLVELLPRLLVLLVELDHALADLAAELGLARLPSNLLVREQRHDVVVHAVHGLGESVHLSDPGGVLLADRLLEDHLVLDVLLALLLGPALERAHLVVLLADDILVAKRRLLNLVSNLAVQLRELIVQIALELSHQGLFPGVRDLLQPRDALLEPRLRVRAAPLLNLELLRQRAAQLLRRVELGAHVPDLLKRVVRVPLPLHARDVRLQDLALRRVFPARVRDVAREPRDLRAELIEPPRVRALLDADPLLNLVEVIPRPDHRHLRRRLDAHGLRPGLLHVRLRRLDAAPHLRHERLGARVRLLQRRDAGLERLVRAALAAELLLPRRLGNRDATLEVTKTRRLRRVLALRDHEALLELANDARVGAPAAAAAAAAAARGRARPRPAARSGGRAPRPGPGRAGTHGVVGGRSRRADRRR